MWKNSLKNVESDNNKILNETLLDFFLQRNGTYFLNKPRIIQNPDLQLCFPLHFPISPTFYGCRADFRIVSVSMKKNHTWPFFMTRILSHVVTDDSLCAIVKIVQSLNSFWTVL